MNPSSSIAESSTSALHSPSLDRDETDDLMSNNDEEAAMNVDTSTNGNGHTDDVDDITLNESGYVNDQGVNPEGKRVKVSQSLL